MPAMAGREVPGHAGLTRWDTLRPSRRPAWATWRAAAVALVVCGGAVFAAAHVRHGRSTSFSFAGPVDRVSVTVDAGSVDVTGGPGPGLRVVGHTHALVGSPSPATENVTDGLLRVVGLCPGGLVLRCRTDFRIEVPAGTFVDVITGSADVTVRGMARAVQVTSTRGTLSFGNLSGASLDARTSFGAVRGADVAAVQVAVVARHDVTLALTNVADSVSVRTTKGAVDVTVPDAPYLVKTDSAIGEVDVQVTRNPDARRLITVTAPEGDIHVRRAG